jgi:hypothetical protein
MPKVMLGARSRSGGSALVVKYAWTASNDKNNIKKNTSLLLVLLFDKFHIRQLAASRFSSLSGRLDV